VEHRLQFHEAGRIRIVFLPEWVFHSRLMLELELVKLPAKLVRIAWVRVFDLNKMIQENWSKSRARC
jgi:hypothetical protein